jgi:hypothetical protein
MQKAPWGLYAFLPPGLFSALRPLWVNSPIVTGPRVLYDHGNFTLKRAIMKRILLTAAIVSFAATSAFAGGPVNVGGEPEVIVNPPAAGSVGSGPILGVVGGLALLCLIACGSNGGSTTTTNEPGPSEL